MTRTMYEGFGSIKVKVVGEAFWEKVFSDSDALRVGWYRIAKVNDIWAVMEDGVGYPEGTLYPTLQDAVSYCVEAYFLRRLKVEMGGVGYELATMEESK